MKSTFLRRLCGAAFTGLVATTAVAQGYPAKPVTIIVPYAVGGTTDIVARMVAQQVGNGLGQPLVVDNKTGGAGAIGWGTVARSVPDGYTLLTTEMSMTVAPAIQPQLPFDEKKGFAHIATAASAPHVLVVNPAVPAKTLREFIAHAKANAGKLSYASQGNGSTSHLTFELFKSRTGIQINHVPYRGAAPAVNDLAGGHVDTMFCDLGTILPLHSGNRVRIIAAATSKRIAQLPDIPTIDESALPGFVSTTFFSLMAPPGTPREIREKLNSAIVAAMRTPQAEEKLKSIFVEASDLDVTAMDAYIKAEAKLWGGVIRAANITVEQ